LARVARRSTSSTHGPAALAIARACTRVSPEASRKVARHIVSSRSSAMHSVRVRISAPRSFASSALSTTSRESSTQQSEYSNPRLSDGLRIAPCGGWRRSTLFVGGSSFRPPIWS